MKVAPAGGASDHGRSRNVHLGPLGSGIHDGEDVARVDPELADRLADVVAEKLGLL